MPTYNVTCVPCAATSEILVSFLERNRQICSCGHRYETTPSVPNVVGDWKPWEDVADPGGKFPMRYGGRSEHREICKQRSGDHGIVWHPDKQVK